MNTQTVVTPQMADAMARKVRRGTATRGWRRRRGPLPRDGEARGARPHARDGDRGGRMTLSTMDIPFSPDMGGREGLSAMGYSRTKKTACYELWQSSSYTAEISLSRHGGEHWQAKFKSALGYSIGANADQLRAALKRIEELEGGDGR